MLSTHTQSFVSRLVIDSNRLLSPRQWKDERLMNLPQCVPPSDPAALLALLAGKHPDSGSQGRPAPAPPVARCWNWCGCVAVWQRLHQLQRSQRRWWQRQWRLCCSHYSFRHRGRRRRQRRRLQKSISRVELALVELLQRELWCLKLQLQQARHN